MHGCCTSLTMQIQFGDSTPNYRKLCEWTIEHVLCDCELDKSVRWAVHISRICVQCLFFMSFECNLQSIPAHFHYILYMKRQLVLICIIRTKQNTYKHPAKAILQRKMLSNYQYTLSFSPSLFFLSFALLLECVWCSEFSGKDCVSVCVAFVCRYRHRQHCRCHDKSNDFSHGLCSTNFHVISMTNGLCWRFSELHCSKQRFYFREEIDILTVLNQWNERQMHSNRLKSYVICLPI